jgi:hypothetical protein
MHTFTDKGPCSLPDCMVPGIVHAARKRSSLSLPSSARPLWRPRMFGSKQARPPYLQGAPGAAGRARGRKQRRVRRGCAGIVREHGVLRALTRLPPRRHPLPAVCWRGKTF